MKINYNVFVFVCYRWVSFLHYRTIGKIYGVSLSRKCCMNVILLGVGVYLYICSLVWQGNNTRETAARSIRRAFTLTYTVMSCVVFAFHLNAKTLNREEPQQHPTVCKCARRIGRTKLFRPGYNKCKPPSHCDEGPFKSFVSPVRAPEVDRASVLCIQSHFLAFYLR